MENIKLETKDLIQIYLYIIKHKTIYFNVKNYCLKAELYKSYYSVIIVTSINEYWPIGENELWEIGTWKLRRR